MPTKNSPQHFTSCRAKAATYKTQSLVRVDKSKLTASPKTETAANIVFRAEHWQWQ